MAVSTLPTQVSPPELSLSEEPPARVSGAEVLALPVLAGGEDGSTEGVTLGPGAAELLDAAELDLFAVLEHARATGKAGEVTAVPVASSGGLAGTDLRLVLLVGVGSGTPKELRRAGAAIARRTKDLDTVATSVPAVGDDAGLRAFVEGAVLGSFEYHLRSNGPKARPVRRIVIAGGTFAPDVLERGLVVAMAGLAFADPGHGALEHEEPAVVRRPGATHRPAGRPDHDRARRAGARGAGVRRHRRGRQGLGHAAAAAAARVHPCHRQARASSTW